MAEKYDCTWDEIKELSVEIGQRIKDRGEDIQTVIGLSRGGLVPGVIISQILNVKFVPVIWQTRDGLTKEKKRIRMYDTETTLVVDDLVDSGLTFYEVTETAPNVKYCALFNKQASIALDFWGKTLYNDPRWIIFPWEV